MARIGYARVSTGEQELGLQRDALAGCERVFEDRASGARADRPGLEQALAYVRQGDVLVVWKLDRLGRSLPHLIDTARDLERRGVGLQSLTEQIDTTTPGGRLIFHVFGALGQFERDLIRERTRAGRDHRHADGQDEEEGADEFNEIFFHNQFFAGKRLSGLKPACESKSAAERRGNQPMPSSSTSKISVAFGGMAPG